MNISVVETNRGQKSIIWDGYRYRLDGTPGDAPCKARIRTDAECSSVISHRMSIQTHRMSKNGEAVHIRLRAKKKAAEDTCVRP